MPQSAFQTPSTPVDERPLWDLIFGLLAYRAVLVAHHLSLFPLLAEQPRTLTDICEALQIARRPARALLTTCVASGLLTADEERYALTPLAKAYLLASSPTYFGGFFDLLLANDAVFSFESVKQAVCTNTAQVYSGEELFKSHEAQAALARAFTRGMHGHSAGAAFAWPATVDLAGHHMLLDVGGGSGIHAIGAVRAWPHLQAIVFDLPPVCEVTSEVVAQHGLHQQIKTCAGDWWHDPFPPADVHFYADIYHDWPPDTCRFLARKSFESLPPGGSIMLHEMLYNTDKTGPLSAAAYSVAMLLWTEGQQYSGRELAALLAEAGFVDITITPTFGYWSLVMGRKR